MSTQPFDPYTKWLSIPKHQRPPTMYQLLGIAPDEPDPEVIEEAVIRQSAHVRTYQAGQYAKEASRILTEIAQARLTLLNPEKRKAYDATLVKPQPVPSTVADAPGTPAQPLPIPEPTDSQSGKLHLQPAELVKSPVAKEAWPINPVSQGNRVSCPRGKSKRQSWDLEKIGILAAVGLGVAGVLTAGILFYYLALPEPTSVAERQPGSSGAIADEATRSQPAPPPLASPPIAEPGPVPPVSDRADPPQASPPEQFPAPGRRSRMPPIARVPESPDLPPAAVTPPPPPRFPAGAARMPPVPRGFKPEFEPGDLYLLSINGASRIDLESGRGSVLIPFDVEGPHSFCFRSAEELYVLGGVHRGGLCGVFDKTANRIRFVTDALPRNPSGNQPAAGCLVVDALGNAYTPHFRGYGLTKIAPDGRVTILCQDDSLLWAEPIAISPKGDLFVVAAPRRQLNHAKVFRVDPATGQMTELCQLTDWNVSGLAADGAGNLYLCSKNQVLKLPSKQAGSGDPRPGLQVLAEVNRAYRAAVGPDGGLYVLTNDGRPSLFRFDLKTGEKKLVAEQLMHATDLAFVPPVNPSAVAEGRGAGGEPAPPGRRPAPDADALARAAKEIRELFKAELAAKRPPPMLSAANTLLRQAQTTLDDRASRYVLFELAQDLAAKAGDLNQAWSIIGQWGEDFDISVKELRLKALSSAGQSAALNGNAQAVKDLIQDALHWCVELRAEEDFEGALSILAAAETASRKLGSTDQATKAVQLVLKETKERQKECQDVEAARKVLVDSPTDPKANLVVGRYLCFAKGDWGAGLEHLARGEDAKLKALAEREQTLANEPAAQMSIADDWWEYAQTAAGRIKQSAMQRAGHWYREALPQLTGVSWAKADQRLAQMPSPNEVPELGPIRKTVQVSARTYLDPNALPRECSIGLHIQAGHTLVIKVTGGAWTTSSRGQPRDPKDLLAAAIGEVGKRPLARWTMPGNQFEARMDQSGYLFLGVAMPPTKYYAGSLTIQVEIRPEKK